MKKNYCQPTIKNVFYFVFLSLFAFSLEAATYYVSSTGSDTTGTGSESSPWATILKAQSKIQPGDLVYCSGNFEDIDFTGYKRGTDGNWITYQAWPSMTKPTITYLAFERAPLNQRIEFKGFNIGGISLYGGSNGGASYLTFDGCDFVGAKVGGVFDAAYYAPYSNENDCIIYARNDNSTTYCTDLTIRNCHFMYGYNAITVINYYKNVVIENNEIEEFTDNGIEIRGATGRDFLIQNNHIHDGNCNRGVFSWPGTNIAANWSTQKGKQIVQSTTGATGLFYDYADGRMYIYLDDPARIPNRGSTYAWKLGSATFFTPSGSGDNAHSDGISIESAGTNFNIYRNIIHDITGQGIKTGQGDPQNVRICSNLFYDTGSHSAYFETGTIYMYNNTIDNLTGVENNFWGIRLFNEATITLFNNIINGGSIEGTIAASNYNIWITKPTGSAEGANSSTVTETNFANLFVNRSARNYTLSATGLAGALHNSILPAALQNSYFNQDLSGANWNSPPSRGTYQYGSGGPASYTLNITASNGTVAKSPDKTTYTNGETVTLTATANAGYSFGSWTGGATGTANPVTVTMNANKTVTANFTQNSGTTYSLSITALNGSVTKSPDKTTYASGEVVTLTAVAGTGYSFTSWTGGATGATNPVTVTMNANKSVTANFTQNTYTLTVTATNGSVAKSPSTATYTHGQVVTLTATANTGYTFSSWTGNATGTTNPVTVTMNSNKAVTANFAQNITTLLNSTVVSQLSEQTFSGAGDYQAVSTSGWNLSGTTITLWASPGNLSGSHYILGHTIAGTWSNRIQLYLADSSLGVGLGDNHSLNASLSTLQTGQWYFISLSWDGTNYTVQVNNQIVGTGTYTGLTSLETFADIGNNGSADDRTEPFAGTIDDIRIYGRTLLNTEVTSLFNYGRTTTTPTTYTLSVTAANGTVTKSPDKTAYASGETVTLTATANTGYTFGSWTGSATGSTNPVTITMNGNKAVTANFTQTTYTLSVTAANGSVAKSPNTATYTYGQVVTLTATANTGYTFGSWTGDATGTSNPVTVTMNGNKTVTANFTQNNTYTLSITATNGSVAKSPNTATYTYGQVVTLTATANTGYTFGSWTGDATGTSNPVTVTMNGNKTVTANFTQNTYTLSITATNGSVAKSPNTATYTYGQVVTLTATANTGYTFGSWTGDATGTSNPVTVTMNGNKTVTANFTQNTYTLSITATNGSVAKSPNTATYTYGQVVTLTATANTGYTFGSWTGDATGTSNPVTVTMNGNRTVTANFTQNNTYTLSITATNGSVAKSPNTATYTYGQVVTLTATANTGYTFGSWTGDATGTTNPITVTMNGNRTVTANFTQNTYTLSITSANGSVAKSPNTTTYTYGQTVTLTATPNTGYSFGSWTGSATGTTNPVTITMNGNKTVTANFTQSTYTLAVTAANGTVAKSPNTTTYTYGQTVTLTATANTGYTFGSWTGDATGTTNPVTITMNGNKTVTANFTQNTYTLAVTAANGTVAKSPNTTTYTYGQTVTLTATPNSGYSFLSWAGDATGTTNPVTVTMNGNKAVTANFTALSLDLSMTAHWMLDENTGTTVTDTGSAGRTAALINNPSWGFAWANQDWVGLDNQTQAIAIPASALQPLAGSIVVWVEPDSLSGTQFILGHVFNSSNRINLYSVAGKLALGLGANAALQTNLADLTVGQPVHIALTWNGTSYAVYVNTVQKATGSFEGLTALNTTMDIGNYGDPANRTVGFVGIVEDIRTYCRALTVTEIQRLYYTYDVFQQKLISFSMQTVDSNGLTVTYQPTVLTLPAGATCVSGVFSWQPWYNQTGNYTIVFTATGQPIRIVTITVHSAPLTDWYRQFLIYSGKLQ